MIKLPIPIISRKKPVKRKVKMYDGTIVQATDNTKNDLYINKYPSPKPDPEKITVVDQHSSHQYPPPKAHPVFRQKWSRMIDNVVSRDNFKESHLDVLEILCDLYVELEAINAFLRTHGTTYKVITSMGEIWRKFPEVVQRDSVRRQIQQYSAHLDLFPKKDKSPRSMSQKDSDAWE